MTKRTKHSSYGKMLPGALVLLGHLSCYGIEEEEDTNDTSVGSDSDVDSDTDTDVDSNADTDVDSNADTDVDSNADTDTTVETDTNKVPASDTHFCIVDSGDYGVGECCSDPGQVSDCWWEDAERDGVLCSNSQQCPGDQKCNKDELGPAGMGRCECTDSLDCNNGADMRGVCEKDGTDTKGLCGPSYCNGYLTCSCWGGCVDAASGDFGTLQECCEASGDSGYCKEESYPQASRQDGYYSCRSI